MAILTYLENVKRNPESAVTVGTFDGVHHGHKILLEKLVEISRGFNGRSVLVTFDPHPREVLHGGSNTIGLLTTLEERAAILNETGVDEMVVIPFDRDFSLLSSEEFIRDVIWEKIGVKDFIIGYDHQFGKNREGTIDTVRKMGKELGFDVTLVEAQEVDHVTVSSTMVRKALAEKGDVVLARNYLERPYQISGVVVHGDKKGRTLGYPTANIHITNKRKIIPRNGVYAVTVSMDGKHYGGMMNIGLRPTVTDKKELRIEVNIFDFDEDIYGKPVTVLFHSRIREEKKFDGLDALKEQLAKDKSDCLRAINSLN